MDTMEIIREIERDPGLRSSLRAALLGNEFLNLPAEVRANTEAIGRLEEMLNKFIEATNQQQATFAKHLTLHDKQFALHEKQFALHDQRLDRIETRLDRVDGELQEIRFERKLEDMFYGIIDGVKILSRKEIDHILSRTSEQIRNDARKRLFKADAVVTGKKWGETSKIYAVVEVSATVGTDDVKRAKSGANLLTQASHKAIAVVAGREITKDATTACDTGDAIFISLTKDAA